MKHFSVQQLCNKQILFFILIGVLLLACNETANTNDSEVFDMSSYSDGLYAQMDTSKGSILIELEFEQAPLTVTNFVGLAEGSISHSREDNNLYYNGLTFHRVVDNFVIQGGDPEGSGSGGPGYSFPDEFDIDLVHSGPGILSMANSGPNTNGSQFFITHTETPWLNYKHSVFGRVIEGMNVVNEIVEGDTIDNVQIIRRGEAAENFESDQAAFNAAVAAAPAQQLRFQELKRNVDIRQAEDRISAAQRTNSGILYRISQEGSGNTPQAGDTVQIHYTGEFISGQVFDSSRERGPFETQIGVGRLIQGWDEIVLQMQVGERREVVIPPELGYGAQGAGNVIPPNAWLYFDIELLEIK